jgi:ubiquinone/menaquinone biosynthesis C-methylase UbiE
LLEEKQIDVYGGEIRTDFLHEFQKRIRGTRAIQLDAAELPCKSAVFDTVFSMVVLNYVRRERKAWFEMARVLRQGGYARLRVSGISRIYEILKTASLSHRIIVAGLILASTLAALCCGFRYKPFWSHTFHTRRSLIRIARTCGFDIIFLNDQDNGRMYDLLLRKI